MRERVVTTSSGLSAALVGDLAHVAEPLAFGGSGSRDARRALLGYYAARHFKPCPIDDKEFSHERLEALLVEILDALSAWLDDPDVRVGDENRDPFQVLVNLLEMLRFLTRESR
jgi:hypothetical protein